MLEGVRCLILVVYLNFLLGISVVINSWNYTLSSSVFPVFNVFAVFQSYVSWGFPCCGETCSWSCLSRQWSWSWRPWGAWTSIVSCYANWKQHGFTSRCVFCELVAVLHSRLQIVLLCVLFWILHNTHKQVHFFSPGIGTEVKKACRSNHTCNMLNDVA